ncbi:MAG: ABC transporter permease [candidate division NC10 bacterium]|nr:ABC transporter permease [candidate division NC10 bacterium]
MYRELLALSWPSWRAYRVWQRNLDSYRRYYWASLVGNLGEPFLYLLAMGYGLGSYIGEIEGMSYLQYLAPGLLVSSAMFAATFEGTYGTYLRMAHLKTYEAILATPLTLQDVVLGDLLWATTKGLISGLIMLLVLLPFGLLPSPWALLLPLVLIVVGLLFSALAMVVAALSPNWEFFNYYLTLFISPMFFFSGVFFPLTNFPSWVKGVSAFLPLTYAVALSRALTMGEVSVSLLAPLLWMLLPTLLFGCISLSLIRRRIIK